MASRTLPATIDTSEVMVALLYGELSSSIQVHTVELPVGWPGSGGTPVDAALILGGGGPADVNTPELTERFTVHSYGATMRAARAVSQAVFNALHRWEGRQVTLTGGAVVYVTFVSREAGPIPNQEPETEWPRWSDVYVVTMAEWAAP